MEVRVRSSFVGCLVRGGCCRHVAMFFHALQPRELQVNFELRGPLDGLKGKVVETRSQQRERRRLESHVRNVRRRFPQRHHPLQ